MASGQEPNAGNAHIRTLLDRQKEEVLADCQAEIKRYDFQASYDRRSLQKLSGTVEYQQEELHRAQAEELHRRYSKIRNYVRAHHKSLKEMEELKKFQSSTFDNCKTKISRRSGYYSGAYW